jgi:hypothetical protein
MKVALALAVQFVLSPVASHSRDAAHAFCSLRGYPGLVTPDAVFFVGTARPDTVFAGPGQVEFTVATGHFGPAQDRDIYGQLVHVERFGGPGSTLSAASDSVVVVVPWDYDGSCHPTPWTKSARFVGPRKRGFFMPRPRAVEHWVGGRPTFDALTPQFEAFPNEMDRGFRRAVRGGQGILFADELFELFERAPDIESLASSHWSAAEPLMAWARASPERLLAYPAQRVVGGVARVADDARARALSVPVAGTYRIDVTLPSGVLGRFFLRTALRPAGAWYNRSGSRPAAPQPIWMPRATGYELYFWHGRTIDELPTDSLGATRSIRGEWPLKIAERPEDTGGDRVEWAAHFEPGQLTRSILDSPELDAAVEAAERHFRERWRAGEVLIGIARFVQQHAGELTFRLRIPAGSDSYIDVLGTRVSMQAVPGRIR